MRFASKVENLPSKFGHARPLGSRIIRYVLDGRTDGRTDRQTDERTNERTKATLIAPFPMGGGIITMRNFLVLRFDLFSVLKTFSGSEFILYTNGHQS